MNDEIFDPVKFAMSKVKKETKMSDEWNEQKETKSTKVEETAKRADPADPFQNHEEIPYKDLSEREANARINIAAKEAKINSPGTFTKEEADKLKLGLPKAKHAEIDAQTLLMEPEEKEKLLEEINQSVSELMNKLNDLGRNEKREQLRALRINIQNSEAEMDSGRA